MGDMREVVRGGRIPLDAVYRNADDELVDPVTPLVDILNPANVVIANDVVPVRSWLGLYDYPAGGYLVPVDAPLGVWTARWTGTVAGDLLEAIDQFEVVAAPSPGAGGTYTADPANVPRDAVRLYLGDTVAPFTLTDAEISWFLTRAEDDALTAAALAAGATAARFARLVDASVGDVQKSYSQQYKHFAEVAERLAADVAAAAAGNAVPVPWAGGISYAERDANAGDADLIPAYFHDGMDDRPGTVDSRTGW